MYPNYGLTEIIQCIKWYYGGQSVRNVVQLYKENFKRTSQLTERDIKKWILQFETNGCINHAHYASEIDDCNVNSVPDRFYDEEDSIPAWDNVGHMNGVSVKMEDSEMDYDNKYLYDNCNGQSQENELEESFETQPNENYLPEKSTNSKPKMYGTKTTICIFCKKRVNHFSRHLFRYHLKESSVREIFSYPTGSRERRNLLCSFRKKCNFVSGNKSPVKRNFKEFNTGQYLPCTNCLGFYLPQTLARHRKMCLKRSGATQNEIKTRTVQADAQNLLLNNSDVDPLLRSTVFRHMRADDVSMVAKSDPLICEVAARCLHHKSANKSAQSLASNKMRILGKLLLLLRKENEHIRQLIDILRPNNYDMLVDAVRTLSKYNKKTNFYETPTFVISISLSLNQCSKIALEKFNSFQPQSSVTEQELRTFSLLLKNKWKVEVLDSAYNSLNLKRIKDFTNSECDITQKEIKIGLDKTVKKTIETKAILKEPSTKRRRILIPWTAEQKNVVEMCFKQHIEFRKPPTQDECNLLKSQYPDLLHNKDWMKIKVFVQNKYTKKLK